MIILENQHAAKQVSVVAGPTVRGPERAVRRSFESTTTTVSLPDYETSQATAKPVAISKTFFTLIGIERSDRRFWRAVVIALIIYVIISCAVGLPFVVLAVRRRMKKVDKDDPNEYFAPPPASNLNLAQLQQLGDQDVRCDQWDSLDAATSGGMLSSKFQYIVKDFDSITFHSNYTPESGSLDRSFGSLTFDRNPDSSQERPILKMDMQYSSVAVRDVTTVCVVEVDGEVGLTLYVPKHLNDSEILTFTISLLLPQTSGLFWVPEISTYLPLIWQRFADLDAHVNFGKLSVSGPNSPVTATSVRGESISIVTSQAGITGMFNASQSLLLDTVSGPIKANVTLVNDSKRDSPTTLNLSTGNSGLDGNVTLITRNPVGDLQFEICTNTFNDALHLIVTHDGSSPPSAYNLKAYNVEGPTSVIVDSKFEGTFDVQAKFNAVEISKGPDAGELEDPYGSSHKRRYDFDFSTKSRVVGWVGWTPRQKRRIKRSSKRWKPEKRGHHTPGQGSLFIQSSLNPVSLQLSQAGEGS